VIGRGECIRLRGWQEQFGSPKHNNRGRAQARFSTTLPGRRPSSIRMTGENREAKESPEERVRPTRSSERRARSSRPPGHPGNGMIEQGKSTSVKNVYKTKQKFDEYTEEARRYRLLLRRARGGSRKVKAGRYNKQSRTREKSYKAAAKSPSSLCFDHIKQGLSLLKEKNWDDREGGRPVEKADFARRRSAGGSFCFEQGSRAKKWNGPVPQRDAIAAVVGREDPPDAPAGRVVRCPSS